MRPFRHFAAVVVLALVGASCGAETSVAPQDSVEEWHVLRDAEDGVSIRYPPGWDATTSALSDVVWPPHHLAVASFPLDAARSDTGCSPVPVVDSLPPDSAFLILFEYTEGPVDQSPWVSEVPSRPARFTLDRARFANYECYGASHMIRFVEHGRVFQVHVSFGDDATDKTRANALDVLDSWRSLLGPEPGRLTHSPRSQRLLPGRRARSAIRLRLRLRALRGSGRSAG